jgi:hypothetical protein
MPDTKVEEKPKEDVKEDPIPEAAKKILDAIKDQVKPSEPQPDPNKQANDWREAKKKEMGWTDAQLDSYQRDLRAAQAPLLKDNALLKLRTAHKDFGQLEKAFSDEIAKYEKNGRIIDTGLAEEIFYMVKGRELSAGRYSPAAPSSQPKSSPSGGDVPRGTSRMAPSYNPSDPGNGGGADKGDDAMGQLSEDEKASLDFMDRCASQIGLQVTPEDYVKEREAKRRGRREVVERAVKPIEIDRASANPADRDLATLWNRSAAGRRVNVR